MVPHRNSHSMLRVVRKSRAFGEPRKEQTTRVQASEWRARCLLSALNERCFESTEDARERDVS